MIIKKFNHSTMNHDYGLIKYFDDLLLINEGSGNNEAIIVFHGTISDANQETIYMTHLLSLQSRSIFGWFKVNSWSRTCHHLWHFYVVLHFWTVSTLITLLGTIKWKYKTLICNLFANRLIPIWYGPYQQVQIWLITVCIGRSQLVKPLVDASVNC